MPSPLQLHKFGIKYLLPLELHRHSTVSNATLKPIILPFHEIPIHLATTHPAYLSFFLTPACCQIYYIALYITNKNYCNKGEMKLNDIAATDVSSCINHTNSFDLAIWPWNNRWHADKTTNYCCVNRSTRWINSANVFIVSDERDWSLMLRCMLMMKLPTGRRGNGSKNDEL